MSTELQSVLSDALRLTDADREALADRLWESLDQTEAVPDAEWTAEIRRRLDDIRSGRVTPVSAADARAFYMDDGDGADS